MNLVTTLLTSFAGSLHCAAMCGGFVALASGNSAQTAVRGQVAYHLGRGLAYAILGVVAGLSGLALQEFSSWFGLRWLAAVVVLVAVIVASIWALLPRKQLIRLRTSANSDGWQVRLRRAVLSLRENSGAGKFGLALGFCSGLLPCGWLWAYVALASTTGDPGSGALTMLAFWLGTLPALTFAATLMAALKRLLGRHAPRLAMLIVLALAIFNLRQHWPNFSNAQATQQCHLQP